MKTIICERCGVEVEATGRNQKLCYSCRIIHKKEYEYIRQKLEKVKEVKKKYRQSEKGKSIKKISDHKWNSSEKGIEYNSNYRKKYREIGKSAISEKKYKQSEKGKKTQLKLRLSDKYTKLSIKRELSRYHKVKKELIPNEIIELNLIQIKIKRICKTLTY